MRTLYKIFVPLLTLVATLSFSILPSFASTMYPGGYTGHDVSYPNSTTPTTGYFGIVGINGGRPYTYNANFLNEYAWASSYSSAIPSVAPSVFINLAAPIGSTSSTGNSGPDGTCSKKDKTCVAYNYGFNAAQDAYTHFGSTVSSASIVWLDIETSNSWSSNTSLNRATISGATAYFQGGTAPNGSTVAGIGKPVGVYSTTSMWSTITNNYQNMLPAWVATSATSAPSACPTAFTGGTTYLVQYSDGSGFDADYACN